MANTTLRRRKDRMYGVTTSPNQYAFFEDGGDAVAALYADGEWVSDRATHADGFVEGNIILTDSEGLVGPGSLIGDGPSVWDVEGEAVYTYEVPAGWIASPAVYGGGYVWWLESDEITAVDHTDTEVHVRLMRARADLTDSEQVGTDFTIDVSAGVPINHFDPDYTYFVGLALAGTSAIAYVRIRAVDDNHESTEWLVYRVLWSLAGGAPSSESFLNNDPAVESLLGLPNAAGSSTILLSQDEQLSPLSAVYLQTEDEAVAPVEIWPSTILDDPAGPGGVISANVSPGGSVAQIYGLRSAGEEPPTYHLGRASAVASATAWAFTATVQPHPTLAVAPTAMFYFGGD